MRERNKSQVERVYELYGELAGISRDEIAAGLAEHERILNNRGARKLAENGDGAKATAIGAVRKSAPNVSISDAEAAARAVWDYSNDPVSLGKLKDS
jgi:hypothetical protein